MEDLIIRSKNQEDNLIERKPEGAGKADFKKTIVAFANTVPVGKTAVLYIGIGDQGQYIGVSNTDDLQKTIRKICEIECYPPVKYRCEVLQVDNIKNILAVVVPASDNRPHFSGPAYIRKGSESVIANKEAFDELIFRRVDKCSKILDYKNELWTVVAIGKKLGSSKPLADVRYRESCQCRIEECNSHYVRLSRIDTGQYVAEPLENISRVNLFYS